MRWDFWWVFWLGLACGEREMFWPRVVCRVLVLEERMIWRWEWEERGEAKALRAHHMQWWTRLFLGFSFCILYTSFWVVSFFYFWW